MRKNLVVRESSFVVVCSAGGIVRSIPLMHHRKALPGRRVLWWQERRVFPTYRLTNFRHLISRALAKANISSAPR